LALRYVTTLTLIFVATSFADELLLGRNDGDIAPVLIAVLNGAVLLDLKW
jgi:hypothetical protein